jgi:CelD/BcsL family acetyltransferase involved in cellulose biosynthesis
MPAIDDPAASTGPVRARAPAGARLSEILRTEALPPDEALRVERVINLAAFEALAPEWEALEAEIHPRTPFTSPAWNRLWWQHYAVDRLMVRDELFTHVVRDARGRLVAVAPTMLTSRPAAGPLRARILQFFGTDGNVTEMRGLICRPADQDEVMRALTRDFIDHREEWDWIDWGGVRETPGVADWLLRSKAIGRDRHVPNYHIPLPATWDELKARLSRNMKEALRKCYNSLKRDGHTFEFRVVERPEEVPAALETFFALHAMRGEAVDTVHHHDVFVTDRARAFLQEYATHLARRGALHIFQLLIGGKVVATRIGFRVGKDLYLYYSGYDVAWRDYSVMTTVVTEAIKWAIERRLTNVNLSFGQDNSKLRWSPEEVAFSSAVQLSPIRRSKLVFHAYHDVLRRRGSPSPFGKLLGAVRR